MMLHHVSAVFGRIFFQRCFYLFMVLMLFIVAVPFIDPTPIGRFAISVASTLINSATSRHSAARRAGFAWSSKSWARYSLPS
ncbi:MAG: hypothetical protein LBV73_23805 [Paraburkholderia sp.]|jgi:uncharacterized membrane protein|nr:hypothetical protein [Paraburkholderia sp.]